MVVSRLGIGPVSLNVIETVAAFAKEHKVQLMLIASRNQVECLEFGGGYVGLSTDEFVRFVRERAGENVVICRDHGGPFMSAGDAGLSAEAATERALTSIERDISAGFDLIHVDCCKLNRGAREATEFLVTEAKAHARALGRDVMFEIAMEDNVGVATSLGKFRSDLEFISGLLKPEFVVAQTGSLVLEVQQAGAFHAEAVSGLVALAHEFDIKFKEHNADYSDSDDLRLRRNAGIDAINVGPEFGVLQTRTVLELAEVFGLLEERQAFVDRVVASDKWRKWSQGEPSDEVKALSAGHYLFHSSPYLDLAGKLASYVDVDQAVSERVRALIAHYLVGLYEGVEPHSRHSFANLSCHPALQ